MSDSDSSEGVIVKKSKARSSPKGRSSKISKVSTGQNKDPKSRSKKNDLETDSSDNEVPLSSMVAASKKALKTDSDSDEDVPLQDFRKSNSKKETVKKTTEKKAVIKKRKSKIVSSTEKKRSQKRPKYVNESSSEKSNDSSAKSSASDSDAKKEEEEEKSAKKQPSEKDSSSSDDDKNSDSDEGEKKISESPETVDEKTVKKNEQNGEKDTSAKPHDDESSTDTSVYNSDPGNKGASLRKKKRAKEKNGEDDKAVSSEPKAAKKTKSTDEEHPRIQKLKKYVITAGLRCVYKQLFADCQTDSERISKLEKFLEDKGLTGNLSLDVCKAYRAKREQQKELAELDAKNIISEGRPRRRHVRSAFLRHDDQESDDAKQKSSEEESDSDSETSESKNSSDARRECKQLFSRLKGIVDSDESD